uniref:Uncharacterized protein n=1 Tax=Vespula pensylvanica TaxID=30213 RepID=A0A834UAB8_VESPE|nr:hypothetical protein H0235_007983 [Vespula pensylvanica]
MFTNFLNLHSPAMNHVLTCLEFFDDHFDEKSEATNEFTAQLGRSKVFSQQRMQLTPHQASCLLIVRRLFRARPLAEGVMLGIDILINPLIHLHPCRYIRLIRPSNWGDHRGINETLGGEFTHIREIEREISCELIYLRRSRFFSLTKPYPAVNTVSVLQTASRPYMGQESCKAHPLASVRSRGGISRHTSPGRRTAEPLQRRDVLRGGETVPTVSRYIRFYWELQAPHKFVNQ